MSFNEFSVMNFCIWTHSTNFEYAYCTKSFNFDGSSDIYIFITIWWVIFSNFTKIKPTFFSLQIFQICNNDIVLRLKTNE